MLSTFHCTRSMAEFNTKELRDQALDTQAQVMSAAEYLLGRAKIDYASDKADADRNGHKPLELLPHDFWDMKSLWGRDASLVAGEAGNVVMSLIGLDMVSKWRFNEWSRQIENNDVLPDPFTGKKTPFGKVVNLDDAIQDTKMDIFTYVRYSPTKQAVQDAIEVCARQYGYNPVTEYFAGLPEWDGWERLYGLPQFYGAENTELNREILALIPRAIYARLNSDVPVKFDYCPVLYSERQGIGKTRSLAAFALKSEYHLEGADLSATDANRKLHERTFGKVIVELGEFSSLGRREMATLKEILTADHFSNRLAYGRASSTDIVRVVFVATTNEIRMLSDTENRRFPVVECQQIDVEWLVDNMAQIYAEVKAKHVSGTTEIALPTHLWGAAAAASEVHRDISDFESWASEYLAGKWSVMSETLNADWHSRVGSRQIHSKEMSAAMSKLGFRNTTKRDNHGINRRTWVRREE